MSGHERPKHGNRGRKNEVERRAINTEGLVAGKSREDGNELQTQVIADEGNDRTLLNLIQNTAEKYSYEDE
jgi:hypothetical protein